MTAKSLDQIIANMEIKSQGVYVFVALDEMPANIEPFATVREFEGVTIIISEQRAIEANLPTDDRFARISIDIPSSLQSIGVAAMVSQTLAARSITANLLSGFHRDHLFVQVDKEKEAMQILSDLKKQARGWLPN